MAASCFFPEPMKEPVADFTAVLDAAYRGEVSAAFTPKLIFGLLMIAMPLAVGWFLLRFFRKRGLRIPRNIALPFGILCGGIALVEYWRIQEARVVRSISLAEVPAKVLETSGLVQRLLADSTGTAVPTESGLYLALAGDQIFLPKPVADSLQKELVTRNLRLP